MSDTGSNIMGFIPKSKYLQIAYWLLLIAAIGGPILTLLLMLGVYIPLGALVTLCGLASLVMALAGYFLFKQEFSALEQNHLLYMAIIYGVFFVITLVLSQSYYVAGINVVFMLVGLAYALMAWTGFNSWKHGRTITKDNIKSEIQLATKRS